MHIPTVVSQEVKAICVSREALVRMRTVLVNRVRSYVRSRIGQPLRATPETLPGKVRQALLVDPEGLPAHLERVLVVLETLRGADCRRRMRSSKSWPQADARMRRLMTVPGVGPVTAARFVAALDDVDRFPNAASVASYLGLIPGENTTGFRTKRTRLTRAGSPTDPFLRRQTATSGPYRSFGTSYAMRRRTADRTRG